MSDTRCNDEGFESPAELHSRRNTSLMIECGEAVSEGEWEAAKRLIDVLSCRVNASGDAVERVICHFKDSLAMRLALAVGEDTQALATPSSSPASSEIQAAYLALNKITPFIRFAHLTANQAIIEAQDGWETVHVVDLEIMQGLQWPPLMQALAERDGGAPGLRITAIGLDMETLEQTGSRLIRFASSLGLTFQFHALPVNGIEDVTAAMLGARPGEALAINCVGLQLHSLFKEEASLYTFLAMAHSLQPKVVTLAEREANFNNLGFVERLTEALNYYRAFFESLEATLPPTSPDRVRVEQILLRREIFEVVGCEAWCHQRSTFVAWSNALRGCGFQALKLSTFAVSQARLLLRLHYPSEGFQLKEEDECLILGWQGVPLFGVSSWRRS